MVALDGDGPKSLTNVDNTVWRTLISDAPLSTPFHTLAWRDAVNSVFDYDPTFTVWYADDRPVAGLPAFDVGGLVRGALVNPFCEYGFPLCRPDVRLPAVLGSLESDRGWMTMLLLKEADWTGTVGYNAAGFGAIQTGTTRRLSVGTDRDRIRDYVFDQTLRANLRTAEASGIDVSSGQSQRRLKQFYDLHLQTMRRKGSPQFPLAFFDELVSRFGDDAVLYLAERHGNPVAGLLTFDHQGSRHLWANASERAHWEARPNDAVYAEAVLDAATSNLLDTVDFGRSLPASGVDRFKAGFGGAPSTLTTLVAPPSRRNAGDVAGLRRFAPLARRLAPILTHPTVGPRLKEHIHE